MGPPAGDTARTDSYVVGGWRTYIQGPVEDIGSFLDNHRFRYCPSGPSVRQPEGRMVPGRVPPSFLTAQGRYGGQVDRSEHHQKQPQQERLTRAAFELAGLSRAEVERLSFA